MKKYLIITLLCVVSLSLTNSCNNNDTEAQIEKCIEEGDFTKAKQLNKKLSYGGMELKICKAQVSSLIDEGQFNLAADVAKEDADFGVYYEVLMGKLVQVYESNPQGLMMALSSISLPNATGTCNWNGKHEYFSSKNDLNKMYEAFNNNIKQLLYYAKTKKDMEFVQTVSAFLKPLYKSKMVKEERTIAILASGERKKELADVTTYEDTPTDYTQANQIKKELGIK
ncbi:MAG: hypothetical protein IJK78_00805 [Bacteroidales bacterium]|nr:hypothetical protein [Bacteroidales bacterium]